MTLILLAISLTIAFCVLAYNLAIYALPFAAGLTAFQLIFPKLLGQFRLRKPCRLAPLNEKRDQGLMRFGMKRFFQETPLTCGVSIISKSDYLKNRYLRQRAWNIAASFGGAL
jgi:hypothetical protein